MLPAEANVIINYALDKIQEFYMNQLEQQVASLIDIIRLDDDSLENAKAQLVQMANTENKSDLAF